MFLFLLFSFCWVLEVITSVITSPYQVFVPRVASNWKEVRFEELLSWKQILCCHEKNSCSQKERYFELNVFLTYSSVIYITFVSSAFFDLSNRRFSKKNRSLRTVLFWQISVILYLCLYNPFFFSSFGGKSFFKSCYSSICYLGCFPLHVKLNQSWSIILSILMLLMRIVFEFCMKQVFKCRERRVMQ